MKWYDANGYRLESGDIVIDIEAWRIGRVVYKLGKPCMDIWKEFNEDTLDFEPVFRNAVNEAYIRLLAPKSDLYYKLHRGRLYHVEILKKGIISSAPRVISVEAPVPGEWMYEQ